MNEKSKNKKRKEQLKAISLYPLKTEEALKDILKIKPHKKNESTKENHSN